MNRYQIFFKSKHEKPIYIYADGYEPVHGWYVFKINGEIIYKREVVKVQFVVTNPPEEDE